MTTQYKELIGTMPIFTAADLVSWLTNDPIDLRTVYVTDRNGDRIIASMVRETLTDDSAVFNLELGSASS